MTTNAAKHVPTISELIPNFASKHTKNEGIYLSYMIGYTYPM